ncbi:MULTISPECIES: HD domain-containing protein [Hyphobacterium]|uniref:Metal-dependent HD superfamily phosphohydrolase n=1 Tax=Hyphobacterium vulgare TaxID=1736751 RepID=A0ABV6ZZU6_9PROT
MPDAELRAALRRLWGNLVERLGADRSVSDRIGETLVEAYSGPDRHYHGLKHLDFLFGEIDRHADRIDDRDRLELAAWFHDWIYDTQRSDNEERSAETALEMLTKMDVPTKLSGQVAKLIRMTKAHTSEGDGDDDLFLDMDFAILGAPADVYDRYTEQVRTEYGWVPDEYFKAGRVEFLGGVMGRQRIFLTDIYEAEFGAQARENIAREIARLSR